ncbi:MAG: sugar ABC transporter permease [Christensenellaceae bacterium]|nr:sugar ABC transporter permease [Christensenellaceae bacterium]
MSLQSKLAFPAKAKRNFGIKRILVHVIIFTIIFLLLMGLGLFGKKQLNIQADSFRRSSLIDSLHNKGIAEIQSAILSSVSEEHSQAILKSVSSTKRMLKKDIASMLDEEKTIAEIITHITNTIHAACEKNVPEEAISGIDIMLVEKLPSIIENMEEDARAHIEELSIPEVRKRLSVNAPYYPLMYYSDALIIISAVFLIFALILAYCWFTFDYDRKVKLANILEPIDYLLPFFLGVFVFTLYPIVRVVIMSFQERYKLDGSFTGWGIGNYEYVLKGIPGTSNYFIQGLTNTFLYVIYTVPVTTALAIVIAFLLNKKLKGSAIYQTAYFLPMVTSITAVGLVWRWIFNRNFGVLNAIIVMFSGTPIDWLSSTSYSMSVMVIFGIWNSLPFTIILMLSGLQNIDETYYTVAKVDGAKTLRIFRRITIPLLAPTIGLVLIINSISAFKVFTEVTVLFNGSPGPAYNMYTVVYYIYEMMHQRLELGRAAAAAMVLFFFIFIFTMIQRYIQRKWNYV